MPTEKELLRKTVEDLKEVPYKEWRYFNNGDVEGFAYTPSIMHVNVYHEVTPLGNRFGMEVEDLSEQDKRTYKGAAVRSLYEHLESQRVTNLPVSQPTSAEESLLEKLMKEVEKK